MVNHNIVFAKNIVPEALGMTLNTISFRSDAIHERPLRSEQMEIAFQNVVPPHSTSCEYPKKIT